MSDWYDAEQRVERAQELFARRKWREASDELRAAIAINPYNSAWHFNLGLTLDEMHRYEEAIEAYRSGLKIEPDDVQCLYRIGTDLSRLGEFAQAVSCFERIEAIDPSFEPSYCGRITAYCELGNHEKAEEMFYLARQYKEHCPHCYYNIATSLRRRRLFDKAIYCWQRTLDLDESYAEVHLRIAEVLREKGELEKARQHYLLELRLSPGNTRAVLDLGQLLMEMGRVDEAGEKFRRAIELAPDRPAVHLSYARWLLACDRLEGAWESLQRAMFLDRSCPGVHMRLAEICIRRGDLVQAHQHLRAEIACQQAGCADLSILVDLANLLMDCGHNRAAAACLARLLAAEPHAAIAWHNLAVAQFLLGRFEDGVRSCLCALNSNPSLVPAMYNLALAYERRGDYASAMLWVRRAAEIDPHDGALQRLELRLRLLGAVGRVLSLFRRRLKSGGFK